MGAFMTVVDRLRARAEVFADSPAVIDGETTLSHGALFERVDRLGAALFAMGVRKGDALLAFLPNVHEALELELAVLSSGIVWITLTARLTWPEVRGVIASCSPRLVVTDAAGLEKIRGGLEELPLAPLPGFVVTRAASPGGDGSLGAPLSYDALLEGHAPARPPVTVREGDVARLRYTSGTTGSAKASVLPHRVYEASLDNLLAELPSPGPDDRALHVAPLTHGSGALVYPTLWAGGVNVLSSHFDAAATLSMIDAHRITTLFTVPTILTRLVAAASPAYSLSSLKSLIYGGAPMPEAQLDAAIGAFGPVLMQIYGMTEAPWPITALKQREHVRGNPRLRSVGRATTICEVRAMGEDGAPCAAGVVGELQIRGRNVMDGYYRDPEATRAVLRDGWLSSGDLGFVDEDGYVFIVGRSKDVIISGGFNVYATEVEAALCSDPRVLEVAVVGIPDAQWGEVVAAFVVPRPGQALGEEDVAAFARSRLSGYKCPRRIEIVAELPKNPSGKILKRALVGSNESG